MTGDEFAIDTNQAIAVLNKRIPSGALVSENSVCYLPIPVVGELRFGALNSDRVNENLERIDKLIMDCRVLPVDLDTTEHYARIRRDLRRQGTPIPANDLWIAAICLQHNIPIVTADGHFELVPGLVIRRDA